MNKPEFVHHYVGWQQWLFWALWLLGLAQAGYTFIGVAMALLSVPMAGLVMAVIFIVQLVMLVLLAIRFFKRSHTMRQLLVGLGAGCLRRLWYSVRSTCFGLCGTMVTK